MNFNRDVPTHWLIGEPKGVPRLHFSVVAWSMISVYLFIDAISGAVMGVTGNVAPFSQAWKAVIILLILVWALIASPKAGIGVLALLLAILVGPLLRFFASGDAGALSTDSIAGVKAVIPAVIMIFCVAAWKRESAVVCTWARRTLWISSAALLLNIGVGLLGYGYTSYGTRATGGIGVTGYFYAGNEVGATYVIMCGFLLMEVLNRKRSLYLPVMAALIAVSFAVATKSAILGALTLGIGLPLFHSRGHLLRMTWKEATAVLVAIGVLGWGAIRLWSALEVSGLGARIASTLADRGWIGVLFSGRDQFIVATIDAISARGSLIDVLTGFGQQVLLRWSGEESTETDPLDLYLWFGVPGALYGMLLYITFLYLSLRAYASRTNSQAPAILLTNILLIFISVFSGHVVLSGMVGIAWAAFNALALGKPHTRTSLQPRPSA